MQPWFVCSAAPHAILLQQRLTLWVSCCSISCYTSRASAWLLTSPFKSNTIAMNAQPRAVEDALLLHWSSEPAHASVRCSIDFPAKYQSWQTTDPVTLFDAPTLKAEANPKVRPAHLVQAGPAASTVLR